jgi:hypothetical protein
MNRTNTMKHYGTLELVIGQITGIAYLATKENVLFMLSAIATCLAIVNYILQINKNSKK